MTAEKQEPPPPPNIVKLCLQANLRIKGGDQQSPTWLSPAWDCVTVGKVGKNGKPGGRIVAQAGVKLSKAGSGSGKPGRTRQANLTFRHWNAVHCYWKILCTHKLSHLSPANTWSLNFPGHFKTSQDITIFRDEASYSWSMLACP